MLEQFMQDQSGSSAAEYALIIALVGGGIGAASLILGNNITFSVGDAANEIVNESGPSETF